MDQQRASTASEATVVRGGSGDSAALTTSRPSAEHQQVNAVRDLPEPRPITPIKLGFGLSDSSSPIVASASHTQQPISRQPPPVPAVALKPDPRRPLPSSQSRQTVQAPITREASESSTTSSISKLDKVDKSSSEWEVLSEAGSRLNEGDVVEALQKKVDKRRSHFHNLANELAELDAQLKATEERLARVAEQGAQVQDENSRDAR